MISSILQNQLERASNSPQSVYMSSTNSALRSVIAGVCLELQRNQHGLYRKAAEQENTILASFLQRYQTEKRIHFQGDTMRNTAKKSELEWGNMESH